MNINEVFTLRNRIINGETIYEMSKLKPESIDLIFADPPYFMQTSGVLNRVEGTQFHGCDDDWDKFTSLADYEAFSRNWLTQCRRLLKPSGSIWVIGSMQCIYILGSVMQSLGFWIINDIVWHKTNPTPNFTGSRLNNSHETLIWRSGTNAQSSPSTTRPRNSSTAENSSVQSGDSPCVREMNASRTPKAENSTPHRNLKH